MRAGYGPQRRSGAYRSGFRARGRNYKELRSKQSGQNGCVSRLEISRARLWRSVGSESRLTDPPRARARARVRICHRNGPIEEDQLRYR